MDTFFRNEAIRSTACSIIEPSLSVMRAAHCRVPAGPILGAQIATYARMVYCVEGSLVCMINHIPHTVRPHQAAVSLPGDYISCHSSAPSTEYRLIAFDGHSTSERFLAFGLWGSVFNVATIPTERFDLLLAHLMQNDEASQAKATSIGNDLLAVLGEESCMFAENMTVFKIQQFFHRNWRDPKVNVSAALGNLGISHSSISEPFQRITRHTLLGYLTCLRLHHACSLLKRSTMKKKVIASQCGLSDPAYFSRLFKKELGVTPNQFSKLSQADFHMLMRKLHCQTDGEKDDACPQACS